jgi:hypothetical protein
VNLSNLKTWLVCAIISHLFKNGKSPRVLIQLTVGLGANVNKSLDNTLTGGDKEEGASGLLGSVTGTVTKTVDSAGNIVERVIDGAGNIVERVVDGAGNIIGQTTKGVANTAGKTTEGVGNVAGGATNTVGGLVGGQQKQEKQ